MMNNSFQHKAALQRKKNVKYSPGFVPPKPGRASLIHIHQCCSFCVFSVIHSWRAGKSGLFVVQFGSYKRFKCAALLLHLCVHKFEKQIPLFKLSPLIFRLHVNWISEFYYNVQRGTVVRSHAYNMARVMESKRVSICMH